jgi:hypothetical protein
MMGNGTQAVPYEFANFLQAAARSCSVEQESMVQSWEKSWTLRI